MLRTYFETVTRPIALLALVVGLAACQAADGTTQAPDTALISGLMKGLGAVDPKEKAIDYKPRAPLVMPTEATALPEPESKVAGDKSPSWPENQKNEDLENVKALYASKATTQPGGDAKLTPDQMRGINIYSNKPRDITAERRAAEINDGGLLTRDEMRTQSGTAIDLKKQSTAQSQGTMPVRRYLTEPPTAYSTPSPDAPMREVAKKKKDNGLSPGDVSCEDRPEYINCKYPDR